MSARVSAFLTLLLAESPAHAKGSFGVVVVVGVAFFGVALFVMVSAWNKGDADTAKSIGNGLLILSLCATLFMGVVWLLGAL